ncbi:MAG: ribbon-helix-helix protein, CopG family [Varibaculum cambriense]|nr:ribbon-helix-helix protein, CopG family [Varibaculum cambriense]MDU1683380.1 ribbon-helix-helix protein, CopG family [Varibaculum cambriense]MDU2150381.1 ribbon-helix-helix protein, CopG family [Varibaculum cambriense]MDU7413096.1 ribbon-helix-helix protein, CopG family [Varibaculum cambriense]
MSDTTAEKLDKLSRLTGRSKSYYLREAIESSIDQLLYEYTLLNEVEEIRAGKAKTYSLEEVKAELGLED